MNWNHTFFLCSFASGFFFVGRYLTVLYFLNDVPSGGETAFPIADNATFDEKVQSLLYVLPPPGGGGGYS